MDHLKSGAGGDNDADDNVTSTPPVQSATAPGTGQKVNIIA